MRHLDTHTLWIQQAVRTGRVDLRKVLGEQNPADLLTKPSISRQRLSELTALFGCKYLGGRAESAPQVRNGHSSKVTMAHADKDLGEKGLSAVQTENTNEDDPQEEQSPGMPHLSHQNAELDKLYPKIHAPEEEPLDDVVTDAADHILNKGMAIAEEIRQASVEQGRRRRPEEHGTSEATFFQGKRWYCSDKPRSTGRGPALCRRRSRKTGLV